MATVEQVGMAFAEALVRVAFAELVGVARVVEVDGAHLVCRNTIAALPFSNSHAVFVTVSSCRMNFSLHFSYGILPLILL